MKLLLVIDMQNDFIDGSLGTKEAVSIVPRVRDIIEDFDGKIIYTRDTHFDNYLDTQEGKKLPVKHCIKDTYGWEISKGVPVKEGSGIIDKVTFGSKDLGNIILEYEKEEHIDEIKLIGLCTDICVISNAIIAKAYLPEAKITVDASACAGVTVESHINALNAMKICQIEIENE